MPNSLETTGTATLSVETHWLRMRFSSSGQLLPWLGPALRGVASRHVKARVCHWPLAVQNGRWKFCKGCPRQNDCAYGVTFESATPGAPRGMGDGQRAITLAPDFPVKAHGRTGDIVPVRMTLIGQRAIEVGSGVAAALTAPGQRFFLGRERAEFSLQKQATSPTARHTLSTVDLCPSPEVPCGRIPLVQLELLSPLFLKESRGAGQRSRKLRAPSFAHLFRASLRTVGQAFAAFGSAPLESMVDFPALKAAAELVPTVSESWSEFRQPHWSHRRGQGYDLLGVVGGAVFADVPAGLLSWLAWGGRLGVGEHRVAGAGCWRMRIL